MKATSTIMFLPAIIYAILATVSASASLTTNDSTANTTLDFSPDLDLAPRHINAHQMQPVGTSCADTEGAWYCMTSAFQRCASGQWSEVMDCAPGTVCEPDGLTYDFQSAFAIAPTTATATTASISMTPSTRTSTTTTQSCTSITTSVDTSSSTETRATESTQCPTSSATATTTTTSSGAPMKEDTSGTSKFGGGRFWWPLGMICVSWCSATLLWVMI